MDDNNLFGHEEDERNGAKKEEQVRFQDIFNSIKDQNRKPEKSVAREEEDVDDASKEEKDSMPKDENVEKESGGIDFRKYEDRKERTTSDRRDFKKDRREDSRPKWPDSKNRPWDKDQGDDREDRRSPFGAKERSPRRSRPESNDWGRRNNDRRDRTFDDQGNKSFGDRGFGRKEEPRSEERIKARRIQSTRTETFDKFASFYLGESNADYRKKVKEKDNTESAHSDRRTPRRERFRVEGNEEEINNATPAKRERITKDIPATPSVMRLNKYIAKSGLCSRRKAAELVKAGEVMVNGAVELQPAYEVQDGDIIMHQGEQLHVQDKLVYLLLNKPKNFITTLDDEQDRRTVMELVEDKTDVRIYPVGRLDRNTTGLLLFTNDGDLAKKLSHPSYQVQKFYHVTLDRDVAQEDIDAIGAGLTLEDGLAPVDAVGYVEGKGRNEVGIEIHIGRNRIVRRIFESLGYRVERLDRTYYAGLTKKDLSRGWSRHLTHKEVIMLKHFSRK